jgi:hypothetical protein
MRSEDALLQEIEEQLKAYLGEHRVEHFLRNPSEYATIWRQNLQCYLLLKIVKKLDFVNTNLMDVENEVANLNPMYK